MSFLKNAWYVAAHAHELDEGLVSRRICNELIVMYRKSDGAIAALEDRCPHRFVPLSMGKRRGDMLQCGYHGLAFDATGACADAPNDEQQKSRICLKPYAVVERHALIWLWLGAPDEAEPDLIPSFEFVSDIESYAIARGHSHIKAHVGTIGPNDFGDTDYIAVRASIVADLATNLERYTIISYSNSTTNGQLPQVQACNPANFSGGVLACQQIAREQGRDRYGVASSVANPYSKLMTWQIINTTTWRPSDSLTIKNIASYSELKNSFQQDLFGTDWVIPETLTNPNPPGQTVSGGPLTGAHTSFNTAFVPPGSTIANQSNFTEELQFQGNGFGNDLVWQAGAYVELSNPLGDNGNYAATRLVCTDRFAFQCNSMPGATGSLTVQKFRATYNDFGLYAQGTYSIIDTLKLTGGFRYTWDLTRGDGYNVQVRFGPNPSADTGPTTAICANQNVGLRPVGNTPTTIPINLESFEQCRDQPRVLTKAPTWLLGLDWKPSEEVLLYGKYSRGYRQGSANVLSAGGFTTWQPEKVDAYEIGAKANWRGALPGYFNVAGFYNDLSNQQLQLSLIDTRNVAPVNQAIFNAGKSRLKGVEVEAGIGPFHGFRIEGSYAHIDATLREVGTPALAGTLYNAFVPVLAGQRAPYTPKDKYSLTGSFILPLDESMGRIIASTTYSFTGSTFIVGTPFGTLPSFDLLNLNLNWSNIAGGPLDAALFVTNVTDKKYAVAVNDMILPTQSGYASFFLGAPRMFGARLRYSFGQ